MQNNGLLRYILGFWAIILPILGAQVLWKLGADKGIMENEMEATKLDGDYQGLYRDEGKEHGNYYPINCQTLTPEP